MIEPNSIRSLHTALWLQICCTSLHSTGEISPTSSTNMGNNLLHTAAAHGSVRTLVWLLSKGMSVSCRNSKGEAPVAFARRSKHAECELLLERSWNAYFLHSVEEQAVTHKSITRVTRASESAFDQLVPEAASSSLPSDRLVEPTVLQEPLVDFEEAHCIRLCRTDMLTVFSEHSRIPSHRNVIRIIETAVEDGDVGVIHLEPIDGTLIDLLRLIHVEQVIPSSYRTAASF